MKTIKYAARLSGAFLVMLLKITWILAKFAFATLIDAGRWVAAESKHWDDGMEGKRPFPFKTGRY